MAPGVSTAVASSFAAGAAVGAVVAPRLYRALLKYWDAGTVQARAPPVVTAQSTIRTVNDGELWAARHGAAADPDAAPFVAFYSSIAHAVTTRAELMTLPVHDHAVVRGHAVFDTCSLSQNRLYRLRIHLDRFFASARAARLPLPFAGDEAANRVAMTAAIRAACKASGRADADVRFWLTAGPGNLGVTPDGCRAAFYVLVTGNMALPAAWALSGISEASIPSDVVPFKPPLLAELKSNNYMLNALTVMAANDRGGTFGIGVDAETGLLTESSVLNVMIVGADGVLRTPPFERILRGTTARKTLELARRHLLAGGGGHTSDDLKEEEQHQQAPPPPTALLKGVEQTPVSLEQAYAATELILVGGDTHCLACTSLDGKPIGDGTRGPVGRALEALLEADAADGDDDHEPL